MVPFRIVGASLSEPHTSVTALAEVCMYVCMFAQPYTVNFKMSVFKYFMKTFVHVICPARCRFLLYYGEVKGYCQSAASA